MHLSNRRFLSYDRKCRILPTTNFCRRASSALHESTPFSITRKTFIEIIPASINRCFRRATFAEVRYTVTHSTDPRNHGSTMSFTRDTRCINILVGIMNKQLIQGRRPPSSLNPLSVKRPSFPRLNNRGLLFTFARASRRIARKTDRGLKNSLLSRSIVSSAATWPRYTQQTFRD